MLGFPQVKRQNQNKEDRPVEIGSQIKKYRVDKSLSQEELAEKVYVSRQTISNWENEKSYPDIHSLLLLSSVFEISLDQLIKGDIEDMRREIREDDMKSWNILSSVFAVLMLAMIITPIPLLKFFGLTGAVVWGVLVVVTMAFALKIEKLKKNYDIFTYKEIVAFTEGKKLDEITKREEKAKRPYQKVLLMIGCALIGAIVTAIMVFLLKF